MPSTTNDWQRFIAVLFIGRFCLIFTRDKFCSVANASEDLSASAKFDSRRREKHDRVSSYTSFALYPLRACLTTEQSVGKAPLFVKYHDMHLISISVLLRDWLCVLHLLIWRGLRKTIAFVNKIYHIATTNYSYLETSAINVLDQDCVHVPIAINWLYSGLSLVAYSKWRNFQQLQRTW